MPPKKAQRRFEVVQLSFNIGDPLSGCTEDSQCGGVTQDCNGPTCHAGSGDPRMRFDAAILVERARLETLRAELQRVVMKFTR